jgi:hypothetical protein
MMRLTEVNDDGRPASRVKRPMQGTAMKYVAAIAIVLALIAFLRAGALECRMMGEALGPRCMLLGATLISRPKPAKNDEAKTKRNAAR